MIKNTHKNYTKSLYLTGCLVMVFLFPNAGSDAPGANGKP